MRIPKSRGKEVQWEFHFPINVEAHSCRARFFCLLYDAKCDETCHLRGSYEIFVPWNDVDLAFPTQKEFTDSIDLTRSVALSILGWLHYEACESLLNFPHLVAKSRRDVYLITRTETPPSRYNIMKIISCICIRGLA